MFKAHEEKEGEKFFRMSGSVFVRNSEVALIQKRQDSISKSFEDAFEIERCPSISIIFKIFQGIFRSLSLSWQALRDSLWFRIWSSLKSARPGLETVNLILFMVLCQKICPCNSLLLLRYRKRHTIRLRTNKRKRKKRENVFKEKTPFLSLALREKLKNWWEAL